MRRKRTAIPPQGEPYIYDYAAERTANKIGQQIRDARKRLGLSCAGLSKILRLQCGLDVSDHSINKWERGVNVPDAYQLIALCRYLEIEDINTSPIDNFIPLLNSEGMNRVKQYYDELVAGGLYKPDESHKPDESDETSKPDESNAPDEPDKSDKPTDEPDNIHTPEVPGQPTDKSAGFIDMPVYKLPASAGTFLRNEECYNMEPFPKSAVPPKADFAIRISGDSMEPDYHDGDLVWVRQTPTLDPGDIGIFILNDRSYFKKLGTRKPDPYYEVEFTDSYGYLRPQTVLISLNPDYAPILVKPQDSFKIVGKVLPDP